MKKKYYILFLLLISLSMNGFSRNFQVGLYSGYSYLSMGAFDLSEEYYEKLGEVYHKTDPSSSYETGSPHNAFDAEFKIFTPVYEKITCAISVGYIYSCANVLNLDIPDMEWTLTQECSITSIPLLLTAYYPISIPYISPFHINVGAGIGLYFGNVSYSWIEKRETDWKLEYEGDYYAINLGFHGIIEAEYFLSSSFSICLEFGARYANLNNFKGLTKLREKDGHHITRKEYPDDNLIMANYTKSDDEWIDSKKIIDEKDEAYSNVDYSTRDAEINFSGINIRLGAKYYFDLF